MTPEQLNSELYNSLCASVLKWFETDRGYSAEISICVHEGCKNIGFPKVVIGDTERNASFYVGIMQEMFHNHPRCWFGISLAFLSEIHAAADNEKEFRADVLRTINHFNICNPQLSCSYDSAADRIDIHQNHYFYPGSQPSEELIAGILDDFYLNKYVEAIAELIETGGWRFPDIYVKDALVEK